MSDQHDRFLTRLRGSSDAVFAVARYLHDKGKSIEIPAVRFAPTANDAEQFVDSGDLIILDSDARRRLEVKRIRHTFTGAQDWPFREVFISNVAAVDRAKDVIAYVTVSADLAYMVSVLTDTREDWYVTERLAGNTMNVERFYACTIDCAQFYPLQAVPTTPAQAIATKRVAEYVMSGV